MSPEIHILVEEPSAKAALEQLFRRLLPPWVGFRCITFQGKPDLLKQLPNRLQGYRARLNHECLRLVVLIDQDSDDCRYLKRRLEEKALEVGLSTKSSPDNDGDFIVLNRIAVEELEAWFLGDETALISAFPRLRVGVTKSKSVRDTDSIKGGTSEALHRVLSRAGYYRDTYMPKSDVARRVGEHLSGTPGRNRSPSFQTFLSGVTALVSRLPQEDTCS